MTFQTKYITLDEFDEYFPEVGPIRQVLGGEDKALAWLKRIEDRMEVFINSNFNRNIEREWPVFTQNMKEHYKKALLEQAIYIFRNSDISVDSGYDPEKGEIMNASRLKKIQLAPNALDHLRMCGLTNRLLNYNRTKGIIWWMR
jgi:hypothetical protein